MFPGGNVLQTIKVKPRRLNFDKGPCKLAKYLLIIYFLLLFWICFSAVLKKQVVSSYNYAYTSFNKYLYVTTACEVKQYKDRNEKPRNLESS